VLLPSKPTSIDGIVTAKLLLEFSDQCRLDIYLHVCRKFYVGNTKVDENTSMIEVCREISGLSQEWRDSNGKMIVDTPEELFSKFLALEEILPNCEKEWPIQLYSTYYTALSSTISDRMMTSDDYKSPSLDGLDSKEAQLEALQVVREGATLHYKKLIVEDERINKKLKLIVRISGCSTHSFFAGGEYGKTMNDQGNAGGKSAAENKRYFHRDSVNQYMYNNNANGYQNIPFSSRGYQNKPMRDSSAYEHGTIHQYQRDPSLAAGVLQQHKGTATV